jgi:alcohol dehydrogenase (NADP+)
MSSLANYFDVILDTVSAKHDYNKYLNLISLDGTMILVGIPPVPGEFQVFTLMGQRRRLASSGIGGAPETQEMLDYCADNDITSDIELIDIDYINDAYKRMLKGDVRYRFVIDMASLS